MADETAEKQFGPKKRLRKNQAIAVMVAGGMFFVLPWFLPVEEGSALQIGKTLTSAAGFVILCLGSYFRP